MAAVMWSVWTAFPFQTVPEHTEHTEALPAQPQHHTHRVAEGEGKFPLRKFAGCRGAVPIPLGLNYRLKHSEFILSGAEKQLEELGIIWNCSNTGKTASTGALG